jgi:hypothetical protein
MRFPNVPPLTDQYPAVEAYSLTYYLSLHDIDKLQSQFGCYVFVTVAGSLFKYIIAKQPQHGS